MAVLGLAEFCRMTLPQRPLLGIILALPGGLLPFLFHIRAYQGVVCVLTVLLLGVAVYYLFCFAEIRQVAAEVGMVAFGLFYLPLLLGYMVLLRNQPYGMQWLFLVMVIVMSGDSAAYYLGTSFGRHKLYPAVSPNKSVEGALGGIAGSMAGALVAKLTFFPALSLGHCLAAAVGLGLLGQLGDLFESLLKRSCGVKDSGTIFPGHGGILDRLDSLLFAVPAAYFYATYLASYQVG
jgi:phosphatidate cytidylyltransferase